MNKLDEKAYMKNYREIHKDKIKAYNKIYREVHKDERKINQKIYRQNHKDEIANYTKKYLQRPDVKERRREHYHAQEHSIYCETPEHKAKRRLHQSLPEYKEKLKIWQREYNKRPEVIEKRKIWAKEYGHRPEVLARRKKDRDRPENKLKTKMRTKNKVFDLLGTKCIYCGCDDLNALEINHINGGGTKERKKSKIISLWQAVAYGHRKTDDLELVCRVCNAAHYLELKGITGFNIIWNPSLPNLRDSLIDTDAPEHPTRNEGSSDRDVNIPENKNISQ